MCRALRCAAGFSSEVYAQDLPVTCRTAIHPHASSAVAAYYLVKLCAFTIDDSLMLCNDPGCCSSWAMGGLLQRALQATAAADEILPYML
jgi:hypothetical protein